MTLAPFYDCSPYFTILNFSSCVAAERIPFVIRTLFHSFENIILHAHFTNVVLRKKIPEKITQLLWQNDHLKGWLIMMSTLLFFFNFFNTKGDFFSGWK